MKLTYSFFLPLLLATTVIQAQTNDNDSTVKVTIEVDEFTGKKKVKTDIWLLFAENKRNFLSGKLIVTDGIPLFSFIYSGDVGCIRQNETVLEVKLHNDEIISFIHIGNIKCGDDIQMRLLPLKKNELQLDNWKTIVQKNCLTLKQNEWVTMRLKGTEYYSDLKPRKPKNYSNEIERKMNEHLITYSKPEQFFQQHLNAVEGK